MAESIVFNNATYIIPDVGESNWGQNLTNFFVAIPQGCYQLSGGTAPLTADLNFGTSFGLFSKYLTSVSANPSTAGFLRLASSDAIEWRNNANSGNLSLRKDTSDNLLYNNFLISDGVHGNINQAGTGLTLVASTVSLTVPVTIADGGTNSTTALSNGLLMASSGGAIVESAIAISSHALSTISSLTSNTANPAASGVLRLANGDVISFRNGANNADLSIGANSTQLTTNAALVLNPTSNQLVLGTGGSTNGITITAPTPAANRTYTIPDAGGAANFILSGSGQIVNADISASASIAFSKMAALSNNLLTRTNGSGIVVSDVVTSDGSGNLGAVASLTSSTSNAASAGIIRLASGDTVDWRNNANSGNIALSKDSSDRLLYDGNVLATTSGLAVVGTTNQITATASSGGNTVALASPLTTPGSVTITGNVNTNPGTSDATQYTAATFNAGGGSSSSTLVQQTTTGVSTGATTILSGPGFCTFCIISGDDGSGNDFADVVLMSIGTGTFNVISSLGAGGTPASRTYSQASSTLKLAMGSGTYKINVMAFVLSLR